MSLSEAAVGKMSVLRIRMCGTVSSANFDSEFSGVSENVLNYMNIECYVCVVVWSPTFFENLEMETKKDACVCD